MRRLVVVKILHGYSWAVVCTLYRRQMAINNGNFLASNCIFEGMWMAIMRQHLNMVWAKKSPWVSLHRPQCIDMCGDFFGSYNVGKSLWAYLTHNYYSFAILIYCIAPILFMCVPPMTLFIVEQSSLLFMLATLMWVSFCYFSTHFTCCMHLVTFYLGTGMYFCPGFKCF